MVKPGSQRQKEYLQRLKDKNRDEYLKKERKRKNKKAHVVESHRQAVLQQNTKIPREKSYKEQ